MKRLWKAFLVGIVAAGLTLGSSLCNTNYLFAKQQITETYSSHYGKLELIINNDLEPIKSWLNAFEPVMEEEFGYVPDYNIGMFRINGTAPKYESVTYHDGKPLYLTGNISEDFLDKIEKYGLLYATGNLIFTLAHEMTHIYQLEQLEDFLQGYIPDEEMKDSIILLQQKLGGLIDIDNDEKAVEWVVYHTAWSEGLAQLYAYKICNRLYQEAEEENQKEMRMLSRNPVLLNKILKERKFKKSLRERLSQGLFEDIRTLRQSGYINEKNIANLRLPFEIASEIIEATERKFRKDEELIYHDSFNRELYGNHDIKKIIGPAHSSISKRLMKEETQTYRTSISSMHSFVLKKLRDKLIKRCHGSANSTRLFRLNKARQENNLSMEYLLRHPLHSKDLIPYLEPKFSGEEIGSFKKIYQ